MFYPNPNNQDDDRDSDPSINNSVSDSKSNSDDVIESSTFNDDIKSETSTKKDFGIWGRRNSETVIIGFCSLHAQRAPCLHCKSLDLLIDFGSDLF